MPGKNQRETHNPTTEVASAVAKLKLLKINKSKIWEKILRIHADQVYSIGLVAVLQPVVVSNTLKNVPMSVIYNWNPYILEYIIQTLSV